MPAPVIRVSITRWIKFNLVGAVGMAMQLGALAVLNRVSAGHYLWATAAALEVTLLHNFVWHLHFTWRDRHLGSVVIQCVRFHFANGAVSLAGNLALMRLLVEGARMPVLPANGIAILCCSVVNFALGDRWVFGAAHKAHA
jgi:putative flippase GtrA